MRILSKYMKAKARPLSREFVRRWKVMPAFFRPNGI
jgi:hypothetical protein